MKFPNILKGLTALFRFTLRPDIVPTNIEDARYFVCGRCKYSDHDQCQVCTCYIPLKVKLATEKCPKKFWGEYFSKNKTGL